MEHVTVYYEPGRYAGWPANSGIWIWDGTELLVGFSVGTYAPQDSLHFVDPPMINALSRSTDGGRTWQLQTSESDAERSEIADLREPLDFTDPDLALKMSRGGSAGGTFHVSTNRGRSWRGPYRFTGLDEAPELAGMRLTS